MGGVSDLVYFLHIPKTAGTSVHAFFVAIAGPERVSRQLLWDDLMRSNDAMTSDTRIVSGHFGGLFVLRLGEWPTILTVLREPVARALSHINHVQREPSHPLHDRAFGKSVTQYCDDPVLRTTVENFQARYLASLSFARVLLKPGLSERPPDGMSVGFERALYSLDAQVGLESAVLDALSSIDAVGIVEDLPSTFSTFAAVLGTTWDEAPPRLNLAQSTQKTVAELTDEEMGVLLEFTAIDRVAYDAGIAHLRELRANLGLT